MTTLPKDASLNGFGIGQSLAILEGDAPTQDKREAMSAIGRRRDPQFIPLLMRRSRSPNPDVALQAIRGLLALKRFPEVADYLWTKPRQRRPPTSGSPPLAAGSRALARFAKTAR